MPTEDLIKWFEDEYFKDIQRELPSYFDDSDVISDAVVFGSKKWKKTPEGLDSAINSWEKVLRDKADDIVDKNMEKDIEALDKIIGLSSEGQDRVKERIDKLIDEKKASELLTLPTPRQSATQERIREEIAEKSADITRSDLLKVTRTGMKVSTIATGLGLSESDARTKLEEEGFTIEKDRIAKE